MASPATQESTGTFRVVNKHITRASIVALKMGEKADGTPNIVNQPGPMERVEIGDELTDVTEAELRAFPDRFEAVDEQARQTMQKVQGTGGGEEDLPKDNADTPVEPGPFVPGAPNSPQDRDTPPQPLGETAAQQSARQSVQPRVAGGRAQPERQEVQTPSERRGVSTLTGEPPTSGEPPRPGEPPPPPTDPTAPPRRRT